MKNCNTNVSCLSISVKQLHKTPETLMLTEPATIILSCFNCGFSLTAQELMLFFSKHTILLRGAWRECRLCVSDCAAHVQDILVVTPMVQAVEVNLVGTERAKKTSLQDTQGQGKLNYWRINQLNCKRLWCERTYYTIHTLFSNLTHNNTRNRLGFETIISMDERLFLFSFFVFAAKT